MKKPSPEKEKEIAALAKDIGEFMQELDYRFTNMELLDEAIARLRDNISYRESASIIAMALGGRIDHKLDRAKMDLIEALGDLIRARNKVREITIANAQDGMRDRAALQQLFGAMGVQQSTPV